MNIIIGGYVVKKAGVRIATDGSMNLSHKVTNCTVPSSLWSVFLMSTADLMNVHGNGSRVGHTYV